MKSHRYSSIRELNDEDLMNVSGQCSDMIIASCLLDLVTIEAKAQ